MKEMASLARVVDHVECAHDLEAGVRELRLLAAHAPPYNRRSKYPQRWWWVALTDEAFLRLSAVRNPGSRTAFGPFSARSDAIRSAALLARFTGVRTCTARFGATATHRCPEVELSPCPAPQDIGAEQYRATVQRATALIDGADHSALAATLTHIGEVAAARRYETAARLRDDAAVAIEALWRGSVCAPWPISPNSWLPAPTATAVGNSRWSATADSPGRGPPDAGSTDAGGRRHLCGRAGDPAHRNAFGRRAPGGDRAHRPLAGRTRGPHRAHRHRLRDAARGRGPLRTVGGHRSLGATGRCPAAELRTAG